MATEIVHIQFGNHLAMNRVLAILTPTSAPTRRLVQECDSKGLLLDMTNGQRTRSVIVLDTGHMVKASVTPETISSRFRDLWLASQNQSGVAD